MERTRARAGFTLVEILVVICIITILVSLLVMMVAGVLERARRTRTVNTIVAISEACKSYHNIEHCFPPTHPARDSANLHLYLGRARKEVKLKSNDGSGDIVEDEKPFFAFTAAMLRDAKTGYPDPACPILDGWGNDIHYRSPGKQNKGFVDIWSDGPKEGIDDDDVTNWKQ